MSAPLETVVKQLQDSGIVAAGKLENFVPPKAHPKDVKELVADLVKEKHLTRFQAVQVAAGKAKSLLLGGYTILDKIGAGGMGQVFKALHRRMDRTVAIKMLPSAMTKDAAALARFEREVRAAAKLTHTNIVAAHDADVANGVHFLVMEFVEGQDLSALVKTNGPIPVDKAANYILQAARGLEFAHGEGVIHRDIKPANLLVDKKGTVKILDMGLARIETGDVGAQADLTGTGAVMGTIDYMAPEQALSTKHADARADIYSLGCTLYYLLTGRPPYTGETLMGRLLAHREDPIPSLYEVNGDVPSELEAIFHKLLAKQIDERYQSMTELIVELERITGAGSSISSNTTGAPQVSNQLDSGLVTFLKDSPHQSTRKSTGAAAASAKPTTGSASRVSVGAVRATDQVARKALPQRNMKIVAIVGGGIVVCAALIVGLIVALKNPSDESISASPSQQSGSVAANNQGAALLTTWTPGPERDPKAFGLVPRPAVLAGLKSWQLETVRPRLTMGAAAWNKQGTHFAFVERGSNTTSIRVYEYVADHLQLRHILPATNQDGDWLSWSPDGKRLVAGQSDRLIVWQLERRTARIAAEQPLKGKYFAQWSPIGPWIAISTSNNVQLWNPDTQAFGAKFDLPKTTYLRRVAWRPDGARLAVEDGKQAIRIWDPASGAVVRELSIETPLAPRKAAFAWSPDGALLAVYRTATASEKNSQVDIWDADQGKKKAALQATPGGGNYDMVFASGGRSIILSGNGLPAWNVADGQPLGEQFNGTINASAMAITGPQPDLITTAETRSNVDFRVQIGNVPARTAATVLEGLPEAQSIAWNPDGQTIAIGALDKTLRSLNATDGAPRAPIRNLVQPMGAIAWSADGRRLACASGQISYLYDRSSVGNVQTWDMPAGRKLQEFAVSKNQVDAISWSRDGKYLAVAGSENDPVQIYLDGETTVFRSLPKPGDGKGIVTVVWSPDNRHLAVALIPGGVTIYDVLTGKVQTAVSETVNISVRHERLAFSPAGDRFVFSSVGPLVGRVLTLDGKTVYEIPNAGRSVISWSPDDRWIVTSQESLAFYAAASGNSAGRVSLPQTFLAAAFQSWSPDGKFLAYAQQACMAGIVDVERREIVWSAILLPNGETAVINPAGQLHSTPPSAESELCYVCETKSDEFELLKPSEFQSRAILSATTEGAPTLTNAPIDGTGRAAIGDR